MCDLKAKYDEWREWIYGDDIHSICRQIRDMIWDSAVFLSVNESRKYMPLDGEGKTINNGMVHEFINHCFFRTQAIAIRRLLDKNVSRGERSVISLWRLIEDMQQNACLLTRQNIIAVFGFPYDYQSVEGEILKEMDSKQGRPTVPPRHVQCVHSRHMHSHIDAMAGVSSDQRSPDDAIQDCFFAWIKSRLNTCEQIHTYVNKFFAHSASPESRATINADEINVTLGHILGAHKAICEVADLLCRCFFYKGHGGFLPTVLYDQFEHFDKPLATPEVIRNLREQWKDYHKTVEQYDRWEWEREYNKELTGEIEI